MAKNHRFFFKPPPTRHYAHLLGLGMMALAAGCAPLPPSRQAANLGFRQVLLEGQPFKHVAFLKGVPCAQGQWHVYLEGDGRAWLSARRIASDPTPRQSFLLDLMKQDPASSIYLGRPCYHGLAASTSCNPLLWTQQRYSEAVVHSLVHALERSLPASRCRLTLIGYSGGGTLAMLMAGRMPQVQGVVTLAGNLDVGAWTRLHRYTPLTGSLDPARLPPLPRYIFQIHVVGDRDRQVPPALTRAALQRYPQAQWLLIKNLNHRGNWSTIWPGILKKIQYHSKP